MVGLLGILVVITAAVVAGLPGASPDSGALISPSPSVIPSLDASLSPGATMPASPPLGASHGPSAPPTDTRRPKATRPPILEEGQPGASITNPIMVHSLPFEFYVYEMPLGGDVGQPDCFGEGAGEVIWFSYAPDRSMKLRAATNMGTLYAGSLSAAATLDRVACDDSDHGSYVEFDAAAGDTALFMVRVLEYDERQFSLTFGLAESIAPPPTLALSVDPAGNVDPQGRAWFSGWVTCSAESRELYLTVRIIDQRTIEGEGTVPLEACSSYPQLTTWLATVEPHGDSGPFTHGPATVVAWFVACDGSLDVFCSQLITNSSVTLYGDEQQDPPLTEETPGSSP